jgi:spore maturation protein CgeE
MINSIYETEIKYINYFCEADNFDDYTRFKDDHIKDMYSHNFTYINHDVPADRLIEIINSEIEYRRNGNHKFLRVATSSLIDSSVIEKLPLKPDVEQYDYLGVSTEYYSHIKEKEHVEVRLCDNPKDNEHGRMVDIVANYQHMTLEFAIRRIDRKYQVYNDDSKSLNLYVCYDNLEPVGNCELLKNNHIAKIEDFDIIEMYQRKGFGSFVLRTLLKECSENGIKQAYLVTDHDDTAKEMYAKCGFKPVGKSFELMFHL